MRSFIKASKTERLKKAKSFGSGVSTERPWYREDKVMVKYIMGFFVAIICVVYYLVLYFTVFDKSHEEEERMR